MAVTRLPFGRPRDFSFGDSLIFFTYKKHTVCNEELQHIQEYLPWIMADDIRLFHYFQIALKK